MPDPAGLQVAAQVTDALSQAGLAHGQLQLVSTTNHAVLTDGHCYFKAPLPASPSPGAIEVEAAVLEHLTLLPVATITTSHGAPVMITPAVGSPLTQQTPATVVDATSQLVEIHARSVPAPLAHLLPDMDQVIRALIPRARQRLNLASLSLRVRALVASWIEESLQDLAQAPPAGTALLHGDPHPGNWALDSDGRVVLLDWESARIGPPEWDLAALAHSFILTGRMDLWAHAVATFGPVDTAAFAWAFRAKATTATSWAAWQLGDRGVAQRQAVIWPHVRDPLPLLQDHAPLAASAS